jgi:hypothetical protein
VRVVVNPGSRPLTVLLQADTPVIWDFEGATRRVHRAIVVSGQRDRRVAVRGLPGERVEFPELARCRQKILPPEIASAQQRDQALVSYLGRVADRVVSDGFPNSLSLPDGIFASTPKGAHKGVAAIGMSVAAEPETVIGKVRRLVGAFTRALERFRAREPETFNEVKARAEKCRSVDPEGDLVRYHPGGFRALAADQVVSPVPVLVPETYPGEAGLIQLMRAGAIRPACRAEIDAFVEGASKPYRRLTPDYRMFVQVGYVVTRDVALPAALHGAHTASFLVLDGVSTPRGNAGHGCVYGMAGFTVSGPSCLGAGQYALSFLQRIDLGADLSACRLLDVPTQAAVEAIATDHLPSGRPGEEQAPVIVVRVEKSGDVLLVLHHLGLPAVWQIRPSAQTRIAGVLLIGHNSGTVEGIAPATPVVSIDQGRREQQSKSDAICAPFVRYLGAAYMGGPLALALDAQVQAFTGRQIDGFRGGFKLNDVEIR